MMQFNPFLTSIAAPVAAKTVQAVVHVAQEASQSFLKTLTQFRETTAEAKSAVVAEPTTLAGQLQNLASNFRSWLGEQGVNTPFEMQFSVAQNGDPIANVVGPQSEKIVDLLYANDEWLEKLTSLTTRATEQAVESLPGTSPSSGKGSMKLAINSDDAYMIRDPALAY